MATAKADSPYLFGALTPRTTAAEKTPTPEPVLASHCGPWDGTLWDYATVNTCKEKNKKTRTTTRTSLDSRGHIPVPGLDGSIRVRPEAAFIVLAATPLRKRDFGRTVATWRPG